MAAVTVDGQSRLGAAALVVAWVRLGLAQRGLHVGAHGEDLTTEEAVLAALEQDRVVHVHRRLRHVIWQVKVVQTARGLLGVAARRSEHGAWLDVPCWPAELLAALRARRTGSPHFVEVEADLELRPFGGRGVFLASVRTPRDRRCGAAPEVEGADGGWS